MSQSKIKLNAAEEVQEFVNAASRCDFDIDVYYNRFLIDAKSILGVLSLDLTRELTVDCHGESREFDRTLKKFAVAYILHFYNRIIIAEKTGLEDELLQIRFFCIMTVFRVIP